MTIGETIQRLRTKRRLSQEQLAELVGVSRQAVSKWELNAALPDTDKLVPLARALGVSVDELLGNVSENGVSATPSLERPPRQPCHPLVLAGAGSHGCWALSADTAAPWNFLHRRCWGRESYVRFFVDAGAGPHGCGDRGPADFLPGAAARAAEIRWEIIFFTISH